MRVIANSNSLGDGKNLEGSIVSQRVTSLIVSFGITDRAAMANVFLVAYLRGSMERTLVQRTNLLFLAGASDYRSGYNGRESTGGATPTYQQHVEVPVGHFVLPSGDKIEFTLENKSGLALTDAQVIADAKHLPGVPHIITTRERKDFSETFVNVEELWLFHPAGLGTINAASVEVEGPGDPDVLNTPALIARACVRGRIETSPADVTAPLYERRTATPPDVTLRVSGQDVDTVIIHCERQVFSRLVRATTAELYEMEATAIGDVMDRRPKEAKTLIASGQVMGTKADLMRQSRAIR